MLKRDGQYTDQSLDTQVDLSVDNLREQKQYIVKGKQFI